MPRLPPSGNHQGTIFPRQVCISGVLVTTQWSRHLHPGLTRAILSAFLLSTLPAFTYERLQGPTELLYEFRKRNSV